VSSALQGGGRYGKEEEGVWAVAVSTALPAWEEGEQAKPKMNSSLFYVFKSFQKDLN
jgi:hypothetical protein